MRLSLLPLIAAVSIIDLGMAASIENLLRSPQFLLISQYKCGTIVETGLKAGKCPSGLTPHNRQFGCDVDVRARLVRDPSNSKPPKMLYIGADNNRVLTIVIDNIYIAMNGSHQIETRKIQFSNGAESMKIDKYLFVHHVTAALYDSDSQLLYLLLKKWYKNEHTPSCMVFFIRNVFGSTGNPVLEKVSEFGLHPSNAIREDWNLDPYTQQVYYTTAVGEGVALMSLPASRLMAALREGTSGDLVSIYNNSHPYVYTTSHHSHMRVSGGLLFSFSTEDDIQLSKIKAMSSSNEKGMICKYSENITKFHDASVISTIVIRDDDYCLVRDGRKADLKACAQERSQWRFDHNLQFPTDKPMESNTWCTVLFIIIIVLAFLLSISCCCLCWMKNNLDTSFVEDRPRSGTYYPSARPAQYPDNADVSVDKWAGNI